MAFQTRVYDLADLRKDILKKELPPMPQDRNLNEEERMKTGRWSEQFVYAYLQRAIEVVGEGDEQPWKRVV